MSEQVRILRFKTDQRGFCEDIYKGDNGRYYVRQEVSNKYPDLVRWTTGSPWSGGVEADTPIKGGWTMRVVDEKGETVFEEQTYTHEWWGNGISKKAHQFSWEQEEQK
jgi:hypothetical protein